MNIYTSQVTRKLYRKTKLRLFVVDDNELRTYAPGSIVPCEIVEVSGSKKSIETLRKLLRLTP